MFGALPLRERRESEDQYRARLRAELKLLETQWGDWLSVSPRPEAYIEDPYLAWAWPAARARYWAIREYLRRRR